MDRDRHLLFGVLAVQFEQLTAPEFVHAADHWAADPSTDLADVLVKEGILDPADRMFVDNIVRQMLEEHGGDASAALAALGGEETVYAASNGLIRITESGLSVTTPGLPVASEAYAPGAVRHPLETSAAQLPAAANWTQTALLSVGIIVLLTVGGLVLGNMERARRDAIDARNAAELDLDIAERGQAQAVDERIDANADRDTARAELDVETRERKRAEAQLELALDATETFTAELRTRFRDVPAARPGLRSLLESNSSMLDRIIEMERDPVVRVRKRFLQDVSLGGIHYDFGDYEESIEAYGRALNAEADFAPALKADAEVSAAIADTHLRLGDSYRAANALDNAVVEYETGIERFTQIIATEGSTPVLSLAVANAYNSLANALLEGGTIAETIDAYRGSLEEHRTLLEANILTAGINQGLQFDDAVASCKESIALLSAIEAPDADAPYALAIGLDNYGVVCGNAARYEDAELAFKKSLEILQVLSQSPEQHPDLAADLVNVLRGLGLMRSVRGAYTDAHLAFDRGLDLIREMVNVDPENLELRELLASFHHTVGNLHLSLRENDRALMSFIEMLDSYRHESARGMISQAAPGSIYSMYNDAIGKLRHSVDGDESLKLQAGYVALLRYFVESAPDDVIARDVLAKTQIEYGVALRRAGNDSEALASFQSALGNLQTLLERGSDNEDLKTRVAAVQRRIARTGDSM